MASLRVVSALIIMCLVGIVVAGALAYSQWQGDITWQYSQIDQSFAVTSGNTLVDFGEVVGESTRTVTYTVQNNGNVPITVVASATSTGGTVSLSWDKTEQNIAVGASVDYVLTIVINGDGSAKATFNIKA
jgi:hypothetical protein